MSEKFWGWPNAMTETIYFDGKHIAYYPLSEWVTWVLNYVFSWHYDLWGFLDLKFGLLMKYRGWVKKSALAQKLVNSKKSTILI